MNRVAIIDYGMGNLDSVFRAVEECGGFPFIAKQNHELKRATRIILPGVGTFAAGMKNLKERGLDQKLEKHVIADRIPFLGICLGMQLLATKGWEVKETDGLGWIKGEVRKLEATSRAERLPHIGWNEVIFNRKSPLFYKISSGKDFYFIHGYHLVCEKESDILARTPYCGEFISAIQKDNIFGVQFHPEKSQKVGFQIISNFLNL